ncbi:50S ribosomal protein L25/general stress protein Ctc [Microcoleus sp. FACHB-672]|uniref:50S ribosomal protein L25/general stress protein Ctc n=1 Tax=Microcoleus sp. FACHB-672 TaxID=2692825 RepID=UPI0016888BBB|nr:50S ribosomal protein L25/general stress protein Ctc [Microcoleus sp. FACHB-672]MBD2041950.1 50S ribosomal protein L25/general stress protein Ctc [Microcoleus sp. FACHB-672]
MELTLEGQKRVEGSKPNALRREGLIPAVVYGHNGSESIAFTIKAKRVEHLLRDAAVNNTLIELNIPEVPWNGKALLREVQTHPWKNYPYHLSFFAVSAQESLEVELALNFVGEPVGVKLEGGILDPVLTQLVVKCKPESIPESLDIDVSELHVGDALHVDQLSLPDGVVAVGEPGRVVVSVLLPKGDAVDDEADAAAAAV